jgi:putative ABC transport system ATP-binding protein
MLGPVEERELDHHPDEQRRGQPREREPAERQETTHYRTVSHARAGCRRPPGRPPNRAPGRGRIGVSGDATRVLAAEDGPTSDERTLAPMTVTLEATSTDQAPEARVVVSARDLARRYGTGDTAVDALRGVSLDIPRGHLTAVMGPSGSGKSTLMHILAGLDKPTEGTVEIDGIEITSLKDTELTKLRRRHIGFVFQFFNLLPMLTAEENITLPLAVAGRKPDAGWLEELLDATGLADRRKHRPAELSGGQQQRVAVARALLSRPTVLFADEPTGNLDSHTSAEILALVRGAVTTYGQTTVMVTHDANAATIADRILFLADGVIVQELGPSTHSEILDVLANVSGR